ncbi:MAG: hypothetical protein V1823_01455 [Chloroflexota bacterium]
MTIAIGINAGLYGILAADTRITYLKPKSPFYDDNESKVQKTNMGLITGAGFAPLIDLVNSRFSTKIITDTNIMLLIIKEAREEIRQIWNHDPMIDTSIAQTGWIFTYYTFLNEVSTLRVGVYHESLNPDNFVFYGPGDPAIIYPSELNKQLVETIHPTIIEKIVIPSDQSEIQSTIQQNIVKIMALIKALFPYCQSISNRFQVGIHMNGQMGISGMLDIPDESQNFSFNLKLE